MRAQPVRLHVEHLILIGTPRYDIPRLTSAFQRELSVRLADLDLPSGLTRPGHAERVIAPEPIVLHPDGRPERIGQQVGRAVWRSLGGVAR